MREHHLDGLRGWAALVVLAFHIGPMFFGQSMWWQGLLIPTVVDGTFAVYVFFALSGYVLSARFFRGAGRRYVVDMALRRYLRLTLPAALASLGAMLLMANGLMFNFEASKVTGSEWLGGFCRTAPTLLHLLQHSFVGGYLAPFPQPYNPVLWSMFYELWGSALLFAMLLCVGRRPARRLAGHALFVGGSWLAESPVLAIALGAVLADLVHRPFHVSLARAPRAGLAGIGLAVVALVVVAVRIDLYDAVIRMSVCGALILYAVLISTPLQAALSTRVSRVLGAYSFPLYLVHFPLMLSVTSYAFVVAGDGASPLTTAVILACSLVVYAGAAWAFRPVEQLAVVASKRFSTFVLTSSDRVLRPRARPNLATDTLR